MNIKINPVTLQEFKDKNAPATITITRTNISFNSISRKLLALAKGSCFEFELEEGKLYYKDSTSDTFKITTENVKMIGCSTSGLAPFIAFHLNSKETKFKFTISEFKDGRRELIPV